MIFTRREFYQGGGALTERTVGQGRVLHFGGTFTPENTAGFLEYAGVLSPWEELVSLPESCEIAVRQKAGKQYLFVLNYAWQAQRICLKKSMKDMDSGKPVEGEVTLPAFGTMVYEILC